MAKVLRAKSSNKDTLDKVISKLKACAPSKEGAGCWEVTRTTKDILSKVKYVLSTGIDSFDHTIGGKGMPGFPFGRITEIYGLDACGKTAIVMRACVRAQLRHIYEVGDGAPKKVGDDVDVTILYIDNEQSLQDDEKIVIEGVAIDAALARCDTIDQMFKMIDLTIDALKDVEDETGRLQLGVIVIDTIAGTSSKEELAQEWGKEDYSRQPKQLRQGFRVLMRKLNKSNICMICTNQVSDSFKQKQGKKGFSNVPQDEDFNTFGGRALKYYARLRVFVYKTNNKYSLVKGAKFGAGFTSGFVTIKNSQTKPVRHGRFVLLYDGGLSNVFSKLEHLSFLKFMEGDEDGGYTVKFRKNGIHTSTFGETPESTLEEDDDAVKAKKKKPKRSEPYLSSRHEWPAFYEAHKVDIDALYDRAVTYMFETEGLANFESTVTDLDADDDADEDSVMDEDEN